MKKKRAATIDPKTRAAIVALVAVLTALTALVSGTITFPEFVQVLVDALAAGGV